MVLEEFSSCQHEHPCGCVQGCRGRIIRDKMVENFILKSDHRGPELCLRKNNLVAVCRVDCWEAVEAGWREVSHRLQGWVTGEGSDVKSKGRMVWEGV